MKDKEHSFSCCCDMSTTTGSKVLFWKAPLRSWREIRGFPKVTGLLLTISLSLYYTAEKNCEEHLDYGMGSVQFPDHSRGQAQSQSQGRRWVHGEVVHLNEGTRWEIIIRPLFLLKLALLSSLSLFWTSHYSVMFAHMFLSNRAAHHVYLRG